MPRRQRREELAAELQATKDDLSGWEVVSSESPKEPALSISLRLRPSEIDLLQQRAAAKGTTVSAIIRDAIERYFDDSTTPTLRFSLIGHTVFSAGPPAAFTLAAQREDESDPQLLQLRGA